MIDFDTEKVTGFPDGMTIDNKGNLWIAVWNGSQVEKLNFKYINMIKELILSSHQIHIDFFWK